MTEPVSRPPGYGWQTDVAPDLQANREHFEKMIKIPPKKDNPIQPQEIIAVGTAEAARMLSISERTLFSLTKNGQIRAKRVGRKLLYSVAELQKFVEN